MKNRCKYFIGYSVAKRLWEIAGLEQQCRESIRRLWDFQGNASDMEIAADLCDSIGAIESAENIRKQIRKVNHNERP
jgi:hypothetical protein